jgi:hypothetical protein
MTADNGWISADIAGAVTDVTGGSADSRGASASVHRENIPGLALVHNVASIHAVAGVSSVVGPTCWHFFAMAFHSTWCTNMFLVCCLMDKGYFLYWISGFWEEEEVCDWPAWWLPISLGLQSYLKSMQNSLLANSLELSLYLASGIPYWL